MHQTTTAKIKLFISVFIFGTIGIFVHYISLPSEIIALARGVIGVIFLLGVILLRGGRLDWLQIRKNLLWLCLSGAAIGFNWIFLFEAYRFTSVAVATLCYYMAPIFVILVSPFLLKERLTGKKVVCVALALVGMVCISGVLTGGIPSSDELRGILFGLAAAVLYASVMLMNKKISGISAYDKTILQLGISAVALIPYCLMTTDLTALDFSGSAVPMLLIVGIIHTGLAYYLYFGSMEFVSAQTVAVMSYADPAVAVLASIMILGEPLDPVEMFGAVLILGAAVAGEITFRKRKKVTL